MYHDAQQIESERSRVTPVEWLGSRTSLSNLAEISDLTFDCYGTLVDWETGIIDALQPLFTSRGVKLESATLLRLYINHETKLEAGPWRPYRKVLSDVSACIARDLGISLPMDDRDVLANSIGSWPVFEDTVESLQILKQRFRLTIVSNIDDALFRETLKQLDVPFHQIITAEQVRSYKPDCAHFHEALRRLNVGVSKVLHVAQSVYHDHVPAKQLGFRTVRLNRPSHLATTKQALAADVRPDLCVRDLRQLIGEVIA